MKLGIGLVFCFVAAAIFAIPNMTRRDVLFGLTIPSDFRAGLTARRRIAEFRTLIGVAMAALLVALLVTPTRLLGPLSLAGPLFLLAAGGIGFTREHRKLTPFAIHPTRERTADVSIAPERLPWFTWFAPGPFAILCAAAIFLYLKWDRIPLRFPVHWGADGQPNGWHHRTALGVYGPLLFGTELCSWMLVMGLATWFGARRSKFRRVTLASLIAIGYMIAALFAATGIQSLIHLPVLFFVFAPLLVIVPTLIAMANALTEPGESAEPTPNECWKGGAIYYNPNDPALFVEKRAGLGYTFNFANRWCWLLVLSLVLVLGSVPLLK